MKVLLQKPGGSDFVDLFELLAAWTELGCTKFIQKNRDRVIMGKSQGYKCCIHLMCGQAWKNDTHNS